jgi:hypothetical protein
MKLVRVSHEVRKRQLLPIDHIAAERCARSDGTVGVDIADVVADVLEDLDEVGVGCTAPVELNLGWTLVLLETKAVEQYVPCQ